MKTLKKQGGFTLVEIAIVLVIVGLLLAGVLKGQELIENSKIKNIAKDTMTPITRPLSTPTTKVAIKVVATAMKSSLEKCQVDFNRLKSTNESTATIMVAARVACGK